MAQPIKYNTGTKTAGCCIRKGKYNIGVNPNYAYGPTSSTDFWAGYTIPSGGFVSYQYKVAQGPSIYEIQSVGDLIPYGRNLNIGPVSSSTYVLRVCSAIDTIVLVNVDYVNLPQIDNNIINLDAGYTPSYPWGANEWYDVGGSPAGTSTQAIITGDTTFISGSTGVNYSDSYLQMVAGTQNSMALLPAFSGALQTFTINVWIKFNPNSGNLNQNIVGQQYSSTTNYVPQTNCNFLIRGNTGNGFEGVVRVANTDYTVDFGVIPPAPWVNLTLTYNGLELKSYVDGIIVNVTSGPGVPLVSNSLQTIIGGTTNATINTGLDNSYFDGGVGVVNIYDTALDDTEINQLYLDYSNQRGY